MAVISTTQLTNKIVDSNPQDSLSSVQGMIVEWNDNGSLKKFECISGTDWRLFEEDSKPLIDRTVDSFSELEALTGLSLGEKINVKERSASYKVVQNQIDKYIKIDRNYEAVESDRYRSDSYDGVLFPAGTVITVNLRVPDLDTIGSGNSIVFGLSGLGRYVAIEKSSSKLNMISSHFTLVTKNATGVVIPNTNFDENTWITVECTLITALTPTSFEIPNIQIFYNTGIYHFGDMSVNISGTIDNFLMSSGDGSSFENESGTRVFTYNGDGTNSGLFDKELEFGEYEIDSSLVRLEVPNNTITPIMLGAVINPFPTFENDSADIIQECFDSIYNVEIPAGNYYISKPLTIDINKKVLMYGRNTNVNNQNINYYTTYIYTDTIMHMINIHTPCEISGGVVSMKYMTDLAISSGSLNPSAYRVDLNGRIWNMTLDINVVGGSLDAAADVGGYGVFIDTTNSSYNVDPHLTHSSIKGNIDDCNIGINIPEWSSELEAANAWINTINIDVLMARCKQYINIDNTANNNCNGFDIKCTAQDGYVLLDSEKDTYAYNFNSDDIQFSVFVYDRNKAPSGGLNTHAINYIYSIHKKNIAYGRTLQNWDEGVDFVDLHNNNWKTIIRDPLNATLSNEISILSSDINNQVKYAGYNPEFYFKGFVAPNEEWLTSGDNNYPAEAVGNTTPLTEEATETNIEIYNTDLLKETTLGDNFFISHNALAFAEIMIPLDSTPKIARVVAKISDKNINFIQTILLNDSGTPKYDYITYTTPGALYELCQKVIRDENEDAFSVSAVIIRIFGYTSTDFPNNINRVEIDDIMISYTSRPIKNLVDRGGGYMIKPLVAREGVMDDHSLEQNETTNPKNYVEMTADTQINLNDYGSTIFVNNSSGSEKTLSFNSSNQQVVRGNEYTIILTNSKWYQTIDPLVYATDSANVRIVSYSVSNTCILAFDGSVVLTKGDWIKFKILNYSENENERGTPVEMARSTNVPYHNFKADTLTVSQQLTDGSSGASTVAALETKLNNLITQLQTIFNQ